MRQARKSAPTKQHYCILVNKKAANYSSRWIKKLTGLIREKGDYYSVFETDNERSLYFTAMKCAGLKRWHHSIPHNFTRRGKVTALIVGGGDGAVNTVARVALRAGLPLGIIPMGRFNDICAGYYGTTVPDQVLDKIMSRKWKLFDTARLGNLYFFGHASFGFMPALAEALHEKGRPRFGFAWKNLGVKLAENLQPKPLIIKIDAFRFELTPRLLSIQLTANNCGLPICPVAVNDDGMAEVIFDAKSDTQQMGQFLKQMVKNNYHYGPDMQLFRGAKVQFEGITYKKVSIDGDIKTLDMERPDVAVLPNKMKVLCG